MPESSALQSWVEGVHVVADVFDLLGVGIMVVGVSLATGAFFLGSRGEPRWSLRAYRIRIGRVMLLSLEVLVAADIVKTVALETTFANISAVGFLVFP